MWLYASSRDCSSGLGSSSEAVVVGGAGACIEALSPRPSELARVPRLVDPDSWLTSSGGCDLGACIDAARPVSWDDAVSSVNAPPGRFWTMGWAVPFGAESESPSPGTELARQSSEKSKVNSVFLNAMPWVGVEGPAILVSRKSWITGEGRLFSTVEMGTSLVLSTSAMIWYRGEADLIAIQLTFCEFVLAICAIIEYLRRAKKKTSSITYVGYCTANSACSGTACNDLSLLFAFASPGYTKISSSTSWSVTPETSPISADDSVAVDGTVTLSAVALDVGGWTTESGFWPSGSQSPDPLRTEDDWSWAVIVTCSWFLCARLTFES